ncbi:pentapeptide repeat-containing protein [Rothia mucilaginosa]|uniref:pentapeptide repeat-containing protein n=1 Tax=Rothia mucilaginosa TaxID=43675 RepID=UPI0028D12789|nr:pentapeptide repeat-containing protein [Rothia mucilaginosa]
MSSKADLTEKPPGYIRCFAWLLVPLGVLGGILALSVPLWKSIPFLSQLIPNGADNYSEARAIADLRLHILYATGGIIAILTLLQTSWKNKIDSRKVDDDILKNRNDHIRQVHGERRSRYTTAIEQLASTEGTIRLGGVYTLAGLVDEWLADPYMKEKEREYESQVIINNLCAYIRSPFPLAEKRVTLNSRFPKNASYVGNISDDKAALREEQEIRRAIFTEISARIPDSSENNKTNHKDWRKFNFNFRESPVFYPLDGINFPKADFSGSAFYGDSNFSGSSFHGDTHFHKVGFNGKAQFVNTKFNGAAIFTEAFFKDTSIFAKSIFAGKVQFTGAFFVDDPNFVAILDGKKEPAKFSPQIHYKLEDFRSHPQSPKKIPTAPHSIRNNIIVIPADCEFFDPQ